MAAHDKVIAADYLVVALHPETRKIVMDKCVRAARKIDKERPFEAVAFTGTSGLLVGPELAGRLGKPMILVNKPTNNRHCNYIAEGHLTRPSAYLFVDDLVALGDTQNRVQRVISGLQPGSHRVASLLWASVGEKAGWDTYHEDRWYLWGKVENLWGQSEYHQLRDSHWDGRPVPRDEESIRPLG